MKSKEQELVTEAIHFVYSSYNQAKPYLLKGPDRVIRHPEWTRRILDKFDSPDKKTHSIAVTGSKGKGSHAILLAGMLQKAGFRVGLFTSPHLVNFLERIRVDGKMIPDMEFVKYAGLVQRMIQTFDVPQGQYIGPVGILATIASLWFDAKETDVNVFELGRGALHDDVNQICHFGAVLTPVFLEHQQELGPSEEDVCVEKAGVITSDTRFIVSHGQSDFMRKILAEKESVTCDFLLEDFCYCVLNSETFADSVKIQVDFKNDSSIISVNAAYACYAANVAVAYAAFVQALCEMHQETKIPKEMDLTALHLPGRMHVLSKEPFRMVDGAVHAVNAKLVAKWLDKRIAEGSDPNIGAVISIPAAKDGQGLIDILGHYFSWIYIVRAHNPHLVYTNELFLYARKHFSNVYAANDLDEAMEIIDKKGLLQDGICFLGTQSFVGDVLRKFGHTGESIWDCCR
jgi:dihydrofolate synthase / folylpolyglutamate synthase